ncbi:hypothetical protein MPSEU_000205700 [Mayamaea pseudoterrestris]|nr:hypothetical protein MPSEU_000205700 [Mayamaea pseudoterrestris]
MATDRKNKMDIDTEVENGLAKYPEMALAQQMHRMVHDEQSDANLQAKVLERILVDLENPSLYRLLKSKVTSAGNSSLMSVAKLTEDDLLKLDKKNSEHLAELHEKVETAKESAGDMEVMDARVEIAKFSAKSLSQEAALAAWKDVADFNKISSGKKLDAIMEGARVASFYNATAMTDDLIVQAQKVASSSGSGGDWDRLNRLKVYQALQMLLHRDFRGAAALLLGCMATFSCTEMCSYSEFIGYVVLTNLLHLPRVELKEKIIDGPEVIGVAKDIPVVIKLANSYYNCDYNSYLNAMLDLESVLKQDRFLAPHTAFWMRELHILAHKQFLDAYQSVTLQAMAAAFGVSTGFIDYHVSRFIAANRLSAKIDKVGGTIVTNRPDLKNAQYRDMIQKGDLLLNRIQKLSRALDV